MLFPPDYFYYKSNFIIPLFAEIINKFRFISSQVSGIMIMIGQLLSQNVSDRFKSKIKNTVGRNFSKMKVLRLAGGNGGQYVNFPRIGRRHSHSF
jgi:hypothetical protein